MGRAIQKISSYEELVTLVKHTWLPEAVNYKEDGPSMAKSSRYKDRQKQGPSIEGEAGSKNDPPHATNQICSSTKCVGHNRYGKPHTADVCFSSHPARLEEYRKSRDERNQTSASKQDTPADARKVAGDRDSAKKHDSAGKGSGSGSGKGYGNTQKPSSN